MAKKKQRKSKDEKRRARRRQVKTLRAQGHKPSEIARLMGVSISTVDKDLDHIRSTGVASIRHIPRTEHVTDDLIGQIDDVITQLDMALDETKSATTKNSLLRTKLEAVGSKAKLLMDVGRVQRAATKKDLTVLHVDGVDVAKASIEELMSLERRLAAQAQNARLCSEQAEDMSLLQLPDAG